MKTYPIILTIALLLIGCSSSRPLSEKQIKKKNYQEVKLDSYNQMHDSLQPESWPMYPNGVKGYNKYFSKNVKYPRGARLARIEETVYVTFVVDVDGSMDEVRVLNKVHPELEKEAVRVASDMERWIPAYMDGKPVRVQYLMPLDFKLR